MNELVEVNSLSYFQVFVFDSYPSQEILKIIQDASEEYSYNGKFIFYSIVNLQDKTITSYSKFKMPKNNPSTILPGHFK